MLGPECIRRGDIVPVFEPKLHGCLAKYNRLGNPDAEGERQLVVAIVGLMVIGPGRLCLDLPGILQVNRVKVLTSRDAGRVIITGNIPLMAEQGPVETPIGLLADEELGAESCLPAAEIIIGRGIQGACYAGDVVYVVEHTGNVTFPHKAHIDMFGCDECHPDLFKAEKGANEATMAEMQDGASCGACHDGSTAFCVSEDCGSCHAM